jgi:hypothetical protein
MHTTLIPSLTGSPEQRMPTRSWGRQVTKQARALAYRRLRLGNGGRNPSARYNAYATRRPAHCQRQSAATITPNRARVNSEYTHKTPLGTPRSHTDADLDQVLDRLREQSRWRPPQRVSRCGPACFSPSFLFLSQRLVCSFTCGLRQVGSEGGVNSRSSRPQRDL